MGIPKNLNATVLDRLFILKIQHLLLANK